MSEHILISGLNWLGDSIMSMPALCLLKQQSPDHRIVMLTKSSLGPLWEMQPAVDSVVTYGNGLREMFGAAAAIKRCACGRCFVFPNSFRSALIPFLGGVGKRRGFRGHSRAWMLTDIVKKGASRGRHQAWEYVSILGLDVKAEELPVPGLRVDEETRKRTDEKFGLSLGKRIVGLFPGAARGPAKRWPAEHFVSVGRYLVESKGCDIVIMGSQSESDLCADVAGGIGDGAKSVAGRTSLKELAALLMACRCVVSNDSGGMHLCSALDVPVVAVFGLTDPHKTGPMGKRYRVIVQDEVVHDREIARTSNDAEGCLRSIMPERVICGVDELMR